LVITASGALGWGLSFFFGWILTTSFSMVGFCLSSITFFELPQELRAIKSNE